MQNGFDALKLPPSAARGHFGPGGPELGGPRRASAIRKTTPPVVDKPGKSTRVRLSARADALSWHAVRYSVVADGVSDGSRQHLLLRRAVQGILLSTLQQSACKLLVHALPRASAFTFVSALRLHSC